MTEPRNPYRFTRLLDKSNYLTPFTGSFHLISLTIINLYNAVMLCVALSLVIYSIWLMAMMFTRFAMALFLVSLYVTVSSLCGLVLPYFIPPEIASYVWAPLHTVFTFCMWVIAFASITNKFINAVITADSGSSIKRVSSGIWFYHNHTSLIILFFLCSLFASGALLSYCYLVYHHCIIEPHEEEECIRRHGAAWGVSYLETGRQSDSDRDHNNMPHDPLSPLKNNNGSHHNNNNNNDGKYDNHHDEKQQQFTLSSKRNGGGNGSIIEMSDHNLGPQYQPSTMNIMSSLSKPKPSLYNQYVVPITPATRSNNPFSHSDDDDDIEQFTHSNPDLHSELSPLQQRKSSAEWHNAAKTWRNNHATTTTTTTTTSHGHDSISDDDTNTSVDNALDRAQHLEREASTFSTRLPDATVSTHTSPENSYVQPNPFLPHPPISSVPEIGEPSPPKQSSHRPPPGCPIAPMPPPKKDYHA